MDMRARELQALALPASRASSGVEGTWYRGRKLLLSSFVLNVKHTLEYPTKKSTRAPPAFLTRRSSRYRCCVPVCGRRLRGRQAKAIEAALSGEPAPQAKANFAKKPSGLRDGNTPSKA